MKTLPKLLDVVALKVDLPEYNLRRGQIGTIVEILAEGKAFEVEFCDRNGRTLESIGLWTKQLIVETKARYRRKRVKNPDMGRSYLLYIVSNQVQVRETVRPRNWLRLRPHRKYPKTSS